MSSAPRVIGRYALHAPIASGGMGMIHLGRLHGAMGFSRVVAIKRLHPSCVGNRDFVLMLSDEARVAARIEHPNVVRTLDVVATDDELLMVLEFVHGVSLSRLLAAVTAGDKRIPVRIVVSIMVGVLYGLHAAHEAVDESGESLRIVHRDVSPQNMLVGSDGVARVLDFGVAKAAGRLQTTRDGSIKGKMAYMPVEQLAGEPLDRRADIYAAAVVFWEALTGRRLFSRESDAATVTAVLNADVPPPSHYAPEVPLAIDAIVLKALDRDLTKRFASALEMASALEEMKTAATHREVAAYVKEHVGDALAALSSSVRAVESSAGAAVELDATTPASPALGSASEITDTAHALWTAEAGQAGTDVSVVVASAAPRRRRGLVLAVSFAVALLVGLGGMRLVRRAPTPSAGAAPSGPPVASALGTTSEAPTPPTAIAPATREPAAEAPTTAPAESAVPALRPSHPKRPPPHAAPPSAPKPSSARSAAPPASCDPPWTIDAAGVRRVKRECLGARP